MTHVIVNQVTRCEDLVNVAVKENIDLELDKVINYLAFVRFLKKERNTALKAISLVPKFNICVQKYERAWGKDRSKFTQFEKDIVMNDFKKENSM